VEARAVVGVVGGRYRLDALLGEGGMARVFGAFDERLQRPVAVKILRPETEALPGMRKRFQQEARLSARLVHPNIVAVLDYGEDGGASYLVMERLPGRTLRDEIARGPMPPERLVALMADTLAALAAAHRFGVLHRDIKPSNILLDDDAHARITDFGIAKSFDALAASDATSDMTLTGIVLGTPGYLAPERRAGHAATVQSDLYAVGAVMVEALSGRRPSPEEDHMRELPADVRSIATRALATDPDQRFSSAEEMLQALQTRTRPSPLGAAPASTTQPAERATAVLPAPPCTSILRSPPVPSPPARRRWWRYVLAAVAALVVLALVLFFLLTPGRSAPTPGSGTSTTTVVRHHAKAAPDPQAAAIRQVATSLSHGGLPGDAALASSLDNTAAAKAGTARETAAEVTMGLAGVLYAGGGISGTQFQNVATVLQPTGAAVPTTTVPTTAPTTPPTPGDHGDGHHHGGDGILGNSGPTGNSN
jgi:non-specific serine/threonine protein kinase/serine/threonine-protein kinase